MSGRRWGLDHHRRPLAASCSSETTCGEVPMVQWDTAHGTAVPVVGVVVGIDHMRPCLRTVCKPYSCTKVVHMSCVERQALAHQRKYGVESSSRFRILYGRLQRLTWARADRADMI